VNDKKVWYSEAPRNLKCVEVKHDYSTLPLVDPEDVDVQETVPFYDRLNTKEELIEFRDWDKVPFNGLVFF
jgi:hypothetical protein